MSSAWVIAPRLGGLDMGRSARFPAFIAPRFDVSGLDQLSAGIVGTGSVGGRIAAHVARMNPRTLSLVDDGAYKLQSIATHDISSEQIAQAKVHHVGSRCKSVSPLTNVRMFMGPIEMLPIEAMFDWDVCIMATDNLRAEAEVGRRCMNLGIPLFHASVHGPTLVAQVRSFRMNASGAACPICLYGEQEWVDLSSHVQFSCQGSGEAAPVAARKKQPTMSTSSLCSMAADLASILLLRHVLGLGHDLEDSLTEYAGYTSRMTVTPFKRNPDCPCDHHRWERQTLPWRLEVCSIDLLLEKANLGTDSEIDLNVGGMPYVRRGRCGCGREHRINRFALSHQPLGSCGDCGTPVVASPFHSHCPVAARTFMDKAGSRLCDLGASPRWVLVSNAVRSVLFHEPSWENT